MPLRIGQKTAEGPRLVCGLAGLLCRSAQAGLRPSDEQTRQEVTVRLTYHPAIIHTLEVNGQVRKMLKQRFSVEMHAHSIQMFRLWVLKLDVFDFKNGF